MEYKLIKIDSPLWNSLWDELALHPINDSQEHPSTCENNGYAWEYRGSFKQGDTLLSEFIHRDHPQVNKLYRVVLSRKSFNKEDIQ
jgi:hypothetical protein